MRYLFIISFLFGFNVNGQSINWISFEEAFKLQQTNPKNIIVDVYTNWCGPCKRMAATSFMEDRVADVYNKQFINIKIEMEKDKDGPETALMYKIKAYPTLLIIDGKGNLVKQAIGMQSADGLIALAKSVEK